MKLHIDQKKRQKNTRTMNEKDKQEFYKPNHFVLCVNWYVCFILLSRRTIIINETDFKWLS